MTDNPYETSQTAEQPPLPPAGSSASLPTIILRVVAGIIIILLLGALLLPSIRGPGPRNAARRMQCGNHLKQIGLALQIYESDYGCLPPAYTADAAGKPLHSWRTLILPYIEQKVLYDKIDLSKPWDDPANQVLRDAVVHAYVCPSANLPKDKTTYLAVVAPGGCFQPGKPTPLSAITDGKSNTLLIIEVANEHAVPWMSPQDASEELILNRAAAKSHAHQSGSLAVFVDGHTQFLPAAVPPAILRALISIAGNDADEITDF